MKDAGIEAKRDSSGFTNLSLTAKLGNYEAAVTGRSKKHSKQTSFSASAITAIRMPHFGRTPRPIARSLQARLAGSQ
jgi:hypothetical protein